MGTCSYGSELIYPVDFVMYVYTAIMVPVHYHAMLQLACRQTFLLGQDALQNFARARAQLWWWWKVNVHAPALQLLHLPVPRSLVPPVSLFIE